MLPNFVSTERAESRKLFKLPPPSGGGKVCNKATGFSRTPENNIFDGLQPNVVEADEEFVLNLG
jgi:hypothetical protein